MNIKYCKRGFICLDGGDHIDYDTDDEAFCASLLLPGHA